MKFELEHNGRAYHVDTEDRQPLSIPMQFDGPQPNHFGAERARAEALRLGSFVGDTRQGGSCNVDTIALTPHCNGTHTETVSHIVNDDIWIGHAALEVLSLAVVLTVPVTAATSTDESYRPPLESADRVVTATALKRQFAPYAARQPQSLIVRTLPNDASRQSRAYSADNAPAFLTVDAMTQVTQWNIQHLLIDLPSVDRMYDDGLLTNHHLFWNVPERTHALTAESHQNRTITEMIYVPDEVPDGLYVLNLQVPAFAADAAPSRPVIMPLRERNA